MIYCKEISFTEFRENNCGDHSFRIKFTDGINQIKDISVTDFYDFIAIVDSIKKFIDTTGDIESLKNLFGNNSNAIEFSIVFYNTDTIGNSCYSILTTSTDLISETLIIDGIPAIYVDKRIDNTIEIGSGFNGNSIDMDFLIESFYNKRNCPLDHSIIMKYMYSKYLKEESYLSDYIYNKFTIVDQNNLSSREKIEEYMLEFDNDIINETKELLAKCFPSDDIQEISDNFTVYMRSTVYSDSVIPISLSDMGTGFIILSVLFPQILKKLKYGGTLILSQKLDGIYFKLKQSIIKYIVESNKNNKVQFCFLD